jgi:hypothetical protein
VHQLTIIQEENIMNKLLNYFIISIVIAFFSSVISASHGLSFLSACFDAYALISFAILALITILFGHKSTIIY